MRHIPVYCMLMMSSSLFSSAIAQPLLDVAPTTGGLGTTITLTLNTPPKGGPFDDATTYAVMIGTVVDSSTGVIDGFRIRWPSDRTFVSSSSEAQVILGDGVYEDQIDPAITPASTTINARFSVVTPMPCLADVNGDGQVTPADFTAWIAAYNAGDPAADVNGDGQVTPADFTAWIAAYNATVGSCPENTVALWEGPFTYTITPVVVKSVVYPLGAVGAAPPEVGIALDEVIQLTYAGLPAGVNVTESQIRSAAGAHFVVTLDIESNTLSDSVVPASFAVRALAIDSGNVPCYC